MKLKIIREEDCEKLDLKRVYDLLIERGMSAKQSIADKVDYVITSSATFLNACSEVIGPLPESLDFIQGKFIEHNFVLACGEFKEKYDHVLIIIRR